MAPDESASEALVQGTADGSSAEVSPGSGVGASAPAGTAGALAPGHDPPAPSSARATSAVPASRAQPLTARRVVRSSRRSHGVNPARSTGTDVSDPWFR